jgi:thioredoxin reductase
MREVQIAVVGAGPAGLAASVEAARKGAKVLVMDEQLEPGGQLYKQIHKFFGSREHLAGVRGFDIGRQMLAEAQGLGVEILLDTVVQGICDGNTLFAVTRGEPLLVMAQRAIVATGANENNLYFPGWTLPGVMGAGAAQTMMNVHMVLPGKRMLMVGSGNVGLIVAYQALLAGGEVKMLIEAAPRIGGYGVHAAKLARAGVPIRTSHTILGAWGDRQVKGATVAQVDKDWKPVPGTEVDLEVDVICVAVGLRPLIEVTLMAGSRAAWFPALGGHFPAHNERMETSVPGVFVAGDVAGVEEASTAMEEGRLAGLSAAWSLGLVSDDCYHAEARDIQRRLEALRSGPFGAARRQAKAAILEGEGILA